MSLTVDQMLATYDMMRQRFGPPKRQELLIAGHDAITVHSLVARSKLSDGPLLWGDGLVSPGNALFVGIPIRETAHIKAGEWFLVDYNNMENCYRGYWPWWEPPLPGWLAKMRLMAARIKDQQSIDWILRLGKSLWSRRLSREE